jgi:hypothetical protein
MYHLGKLKIVTQKNLYKNLIRRGRLPDLVVGGRIGDMNVQQLIRIEVTQNVLYFILAQSFNVAVNNIFITVSKTFNIGHVRRLTRARSTSTVNCNSPL